MKTLPLGSIAINVESPRQVFAICLALLTDVSPIAANRHRAKPIAQRAQEPGDLSLLDTYRLNRAVAALMTDLNHHVAPLTYMGYHPTDKTQLGVWIDTGALHTAEQNGQLTQVSGDDWRGIHSPYVLDMGKNGVTLYRRRGKTVVWTTS